MKQISMTLGLFTLSVLAAGAQLVTYDFEVDVNTPASTDGGVSASTFTLNPAAGPTYALGNPGRAITGSNWQGASGDKYWEFTVTPGDGLLLDLASISFDHRSTSTGPQNWGLTINGVAAGTGAIVRDAVFHGVSLDLSTFSGLASAQVRITGFGGTASAGTWRMDNVTLDGIALTVVPEPSTWVLLGGGLLFLANRVRRRN